MEDTLETIAAMRHQEDTGYVTSDWLQLEQSEPHNNLMRINAPLHCEVVDVDCRDKMTAWCIQVGDFCKFNRNTLEITMSLLDRFMATPQAAMTRNDRELYQLACMAAFYTAVKVHEPEAMDPKLVSSLSQGAYSAEDIEAMECKILSALKWRVNPPTSMAFVRELMHLIPEETLDRGICNFAYELTQFQTELAVCNHHLVSVQASTVAYAALMNSLESLGLDDKVIACVGSILSAALHIDRSSLSVAKTQGTLYKSVFQHPVDGPLARKPRAAISSCNKRPKRRLSTHRSPRSVPMTQL
jgi:hypothetical protein